MAKLSKIRLTNCKYDGLRKGHENSIFDLTKDGDPSHGLFTLANGGGKGVMMQFIFQIMLPETRWGKNNGNKIISTFYDHRGNPNYFTSHIVLEWVLDTIPEKRLITGIAMKPVIKNIDMEEENTGLYYFLYTYEHDNNGYFTIENLPIYNENTEEATDIDEFENFIDANKRDFIKYSQSSAKRIDGDYYKYLESRGIYRGEWLNLKTINKSEGGAGDYFSGASDNKAIFDKIIIPALSKNIRNYNYDNGDNLVEMFKSNLSITKDLPILIQREGDYKALIQEIEPLIENADSGSRFIDIKNVLIQEGNDIYFILRDEFNKVNKEIEKWENEKYNAEFEKKELEFKKDVLNYNRDLRELREKEGEYLKLSRELELKTKDLAEHRKNLKIHEINKILYYKNAVEEEIKNRNLEKENLIESLGITDIQNKKIELDNEIHRELDKIKIKWQSTEEEYIGYKNYSKANMEKNQHKKNKLSHRKGQLENEVNKFELKRERLEGEKGELEKYYDPLSLAFPERILEDLLESTNNLEGQKLENIKKIERYNKNLNELNREIDSLKYHKSNKEEKLKKLNTKIIEQEKWELEIAKSLCHHLLEEYDGSLLNHNWFINKGEELKFLENKKRENLENIQRTLWEKSLNKLLSREEYFVPNPDVFKIKEEIKALGIHVETGVEFLGELSEGEREKTLEDFPEILYGLIIASSRDWELIVKNINEDLFLNNLVPIYIRQDMKNNLKPFKNLYGSVYELIEMENYNLWKENINKEIEGLNTTMGRIKGDLDNITKLQQELIHISRIDTVFLLNKKYREIEKEIAENLDEIRIKEEEKSSLQNKILKEKNVLEELEKRLGETKTILEKIEIYIKNLKVFKEEENRILAIEEEIKNLNRDIEDLDLDNENIIGELDEIRDAFRNWEFNRDIILKNIKILFPDLEAKYNLDQNYSSAIIPSFEIHGEILLSKIREREILDKDIYAKSHEIELISIKIENLFKELDRYIQDLNNMDKNWENVIYLEKDLNEINIIISRLKGNILSLEKTRERITSNLNILNGSITQMKKALDKVEKFIRDKHHRLPEILDMEDILSEIDMVDRNIESNRKFYKVCLEELERNRELVQRIEINLNRIKGHYELNIMNGKKDVILKEKLGNNIDLVVEEWFNKYNRNKRQIDATIEEGERYRNNFLKTVDMKLEEDRLKKQILENIKEANIINFKNNLISLGSMKEHFQNEILSLSKDKEKAEDAMAQWTHRASIHVIRMVEALKDMVNSMNYINEGGHSFPLVKLKGEEGLPKEEGEIIHLLEEYFISSISEIIESNEDIENLDNRELNKLMGDGAIFSKALLGRYPTLLVYKMSEKNEFKYARPRDEYYTTWEAIMKGEGYSPEGSGGQTLSVTTFLIMMIMSFKKKHIGNENPSTVLILDNPFGKASGKHVLDPIFEIADKLNFQLICFAAPEIIKAEISERFPVFWDLKIEDGKVIHGGRIIKN